MAFTHPGIAGAAGGLLFGAGQYIVAMSVIRRVLEREIDDGGDMPGLASLARRLRSARNAIAGISFLALPLLGFVIGSTLGSNNGGAQ